MDEADSFMAKKFLFANINPTIVRTLVWAQMEWEEIVAS